MLINLISTDNQNHYNIDLAHIVGLKEAVYLNELLSIYAKAERKGMVRVVSHPADMSVTQIIPDDVYFFVKRDYIEERTTLTPAEQESIEKSLINAHILKKENVDSNEVCVDLEFISSLFISGNESIKRNISAEIESSKGKKTTKSDEKKKCVTASLKALIDTRDISKYNLYSLWIDSVMANPKSGFMTKDNVQTFQKEIEFFSNGNTEVFNDLLGIAKMNGWKDAKWSIEKYKSTHNMSSGMNQVPKSIANVAPMQKSETSTLF